MEYMGYQLIELGKEWEKERQEQLALCTTETIQMHESPIYRPLLLFKALYGFIFAVLNCFHLLLRGTDWTQHRNTRIALAYYYIATICNGFSFAALYGYDWWRLRHGCQLVDYRVIVVMYGLVFSTNIARHLLMVEIAVERIFGTLHPQRYEKGETPLRTHIICSGLCIIALTTAFLVVTRVGSLFVGREVAHFDLRAMEDNDALSTLMSMQGGVQLGAIGLCVIGAVTSRVAYQRVRFTNNITAQYQLKQNIHVLLVLVAAEFCDGGISFTGSLTQILSKQMVSAWSPFDRKLFLTWATTSVYTQPLLFVAVEIYHWRVKKASAQNSTVLVAPAAMNQVVPTATAETDVYFKELANAWK